MFCPSCGLQNTNANQFCRACGINLQTVRYAIEKPDNITQSAAMARDEIGRAFADKIRHTQSARELKIVAEKVLPEIEKFLESPEEKRLRRMRTGTILSSIGFGAAVAFGVITFFLTKEEFFMLSALGTVAFFIGLGFIINALFASVPRKTLSDKSAEATSQRELDGETNELVLPEARPEFISVIEDTTRHLDEKQPVRRRS